VVQNHAPDSFDILAVDIGGTTAPDAGFPMASPIRAPRDALARVQLMRDLTSSQPIQDPYALQHFPQPPP
jgi:hypothetical protein